MQFGRNFPDVSEEHAALIFRLVPDYVFIGITMFKHFNLHRFYDNLLKKKSYFSLKGLTGLEEENVELT